MREIRVGFIGLGVMGSPVCRHIHEKASQAGISGVLAHDVSDDAIRSVASHGVPTVSEIAEISSCVDVIHLCLPGGGELESLCRGTNGLLEMCRPEQVIVDHTTAPVGLTRQLAEEFSKKQCRFADAPLTRTRAAAEAGNLCVLFGGSVDLLEQVRPIIRCFASELIHCGDVGCGQVVKQMNNMVLIQTVVALAEALSTARAAGVDGQTLFEALAAGSADSFALRNHGQKALLPSAFPERAFAATYALKDLAYAIDLASDNGLELEQASVARRKLEAAIENGDGDRYFPVLLNSLNNRSQT